MSELAGDDMETNMAAFQRGEKVYVLNIEMGDIDSSF